MTSTTPLFKALVLLAAVLPVWRAEAAAAVPTAGDACLQAVVRDLSLSWPNNSTVNIVAFGHSVPAGYGVTPLVQKRDAYPRLLEDGLAKRFPHAVLNVITSGVGGENSTKGLTRLQRDVIDHHPRVVLIDYALNDRGLTLDQSRQNLTAIIAAVRTAGACPILLTPTWDTQASPNAPTDKLALQATMIRSLAATKRIPLADSLKAFSQFRGDRSSLMAQSNHPNRAGHELVVQQLLPLFVPGK